MILNLLTDLVDPDNVAGGYGAADNTFLILFVVSFVIILTLITITIWLSIKVANYKLKLDKKENNLTEKEEKTLKEYRKLTTQEKQIVNDTIRALNKDKEE